MTTAHTVVTFKDIQDVVLETRFIDNTSTRNRAKRMINASYTTIVGAEDWTFRYATDLLTVTGGSRIVTGLDTRSQALLGVWDDLGNPLVYLDPVKFQDWYAGDTSVNDQPIHYTVIAGTIYVAPTPGADSTTWQMLCRQKVRMLELDNDEPIIPVEYRYILVHAARAKLLLDKQDPSWQEEESQRVEMLAAMRADYLTDAEGQPTMWPADPTWA